MHPHAWLKSITEDGRVPPHRRTKPTVMDWCRSNRVDYSYMRQMITGKEAPSARAMMIFFVQSSGAVSLNDWLAVQPASRLKLWLMAQPELRSKPRVKVKCNTSRS